MHEWFRRRWILTIALLILLGSAASLAGWWWTHQISRPTIVAEYLGEYPSDAAFSGDSRFFALRYYKEVQLYELNDGQPKLVRRHPCQRVSDWGATLHATPKSVRLIDATAPKSIALIDLLTGDVVDQINAPFPTTRLFVLKEGFVQANGQAKNEVAYFRIAEGKLHTPLKTMDQFAHRFLLPDGRIFGITESQRNAKASWQVVVGGSQSAFGKLPAQGQWIIGAVHDGPTQGVLVFENLHRRLRFLSDEGEEMKSWLIEPDLQLILATYPKGDLIGCSKDPPTIWGGKLSDLPHLTPLLSLERGDETSWLYVNEKGSICWSFVISHAHVYIPFMRLLDSPNRQRWTTGYNVVFIRTDGSRPAMTFPIAHYYVAADVSNDGRFALIATPGKNGRFTLLDLTQPE